MKKIEKVDYTLSNLTKEQAESIGLLSQWLKLHNEWENYLEFKRYVLHYQQVYSVKAIQWLYINDPRQAIYWIELNLNWYDVTKTNYNILSNNILNYQTILDDVKDNLYIQISKILENNKMSLEHNSNISDEKVNYFINLINLRLAEDLSQVIADIATQDISNIIDKIVIEETAIERMTLQLKERFQYIIIDDHYLIKMKKG